MSDLDALIQLQALDLTAERLRRTIAGVPAAQAAFDARLADRQAAVDLVKARTAAAQSARRDLEKELAAVQGRLSKYKGQLMEVKTNKEYQAMQHEIAAAEELVRRHEDLLLERMEEADVHAAELKATEAALASGRAEVAGQRAQLETDRGTSERELETTTAERGRIAAGVSAPVLALFESIARHRRGVALSEAVGGSCTQCHVRLRPQVFNEVRRNNALMQCESCSRILYYLAPPAPAGPPVQPPAAADNQT